jgi:hypothetical protein
MFGNKYDGYILITGVDSAGWVSGHIHGRAHYGPWTKTFGTSEATGVVTGNNLHIDMTETGSTYDLHPSPEGLTGRYISRTPANSRALIIYTRK